MRPESPNSSHAKPFNPKAPPSIWRNPIHFLAFGFGSGAMPVAPGTFGTLVAVPL